MAGIALGFAKMIGSVVLGLAAVLEQFPQFLSLLRIAGAMRLLWLAWQLAGPSFYARIRRGKSGSTEKHFAPDAAYEAAMFQWVNPKARTMAVAASAAY